jgi:cytidyltransferase-like protein
MMKRVITFSTFDEFDVGHINLLQRASMYVDRLFVGVSTDKLTISKNRQES